MDRSVFFFLFLFFFFFFFRRTLNVWQCGHSVCPEMTSFKLITGISHHGNREKVIKASAGVNFSVVLTESGKGARVRFIVACRARSSLLISFHVWECGKGTVGEWNDGGEDNHWE